MLISSDASSRKSLPSEMPPACHNLKPAFIFISAPFIYNTVYHLRLSQAVLPSHGIQGKLQMRPTLVKIPTLIYFQNAWRCLFVQQLVTSCHCTIYGQECWSCRSNTTEAKKKKQKGEFSLISNKFLIKKQRRAHVHVHKATLSLQWNMCIIHGTQHYATVKC